MVPDAAGGLALPYMTLGRGSHPGFASPKVFQQDNTQAKINCHVAQLHGASDR